MAFMAIGGLDKVNWSRKGLILANLVQDERVCSIFPGGMGDSATM